MEATAVHQAEWDGLAAEWDALADRAGAPPWLRPGWAHAWWEAFGHGRSELALLHREGRLVGVAPLRRHRGRLCSAANWHSPSSGLLAEDEAARRALAASLLGKRPRSLALHFLAAESGDVEAVAAAAGEAGYGLTTRVQMRSPYIPTDGDFDAYAEAAGLTRKVLKDLRRRRRRLEREAGAPVRLRMERGVEHFDALVRLEGSGWKERGGTAIASSPQTRAFYEEVARWAAERGMLRLAFLDVGSTPIAADLMLEDRGAWHTLKRGYDERYRAHAPGKLILEDLLRAACEGPIERLELLGSQDPYKLEWTDRVRERVLLQAFAPTPAGQTERVAQRFGRPLAKRALALLHL